MTPRFDPTRSIIYDLAQGQLRDDEGTARLNVPFHILSRLLTQAGPEGAADFGRGLGGEVGRRIHQRLDPKANVTAWAEHLGGHLALLGLGNLRVERWGRALVFRVAGAPEGAQTLIGHVLEGALLRGLGRHVSIVGFEAEGGMAYLALSRDTSSRVRALRSAGESLSEVVQQLHRGAA